MSVYALCWRNVCCCYCGAPSVSLAAEPFANMCAYFISIDLYQGEVSSRVPWTCSFWRDFSISILQTRCEMYWKVVIVGWSVEYTHDTFPRRNFVSCLVEPVDPVIGVWESPYRNSFFWIFFRPYIWDDGGIFLEVKNPKNFDPIWGFHPNFFFKIHQFLVITRIDDPRGPFIGRKECTYWTL